MDPLIRIAVSDKSGWQRDFFLNEKLVYIGSALDNHIILDSGRGTGVASRHLQLVLAQGAKPGYRIINLGDSELVLGDQALAPRAVGALNDQDRLQLGDFLLVFHLDEQRLANLPRIQEAILPEKEMDTETRQATDDIGIELFLAQTRLQVDLPIEGSVIIRNLGPMPGVQFRLGLKGLPPECCELGPGPILFPDAKKDVLLRLHHPKRPRPLGNSKHRIYIYVTAPKEYPGQSVEVSQVIDIDPYYHHELHFDTTCEAVT